MHSLVNIANKHNVDPQKAIERANDKFISRFKMTEHLVDTDEKKMNKLNLKEILNYWKQAKQKVAESE